MAIIINPDYDLFIQIIFVWWVLKIFINLICGLMQTDKLYPKKAGIIEIISAVIGAIVITVCLV
jgi:hypothetical protein